MDKVYKIYWTNEEGISTEEEDSTVTVKDILFQALSSIACLSESYRNELSDNDTVCTPSLQSTHCKFKAMFVGTFKEKVSDEEFIKIHKLLQDKIKCTDFFHKGLVEFPFKGQLILPVNNLKGGQVEIEHTRKMLERDPSLMADGLHMRRAKLCTMTLVKWS